MDQSIKPARDLVALARLLRHYGRQTSLPGYRDKMFYAAAQVEAQILLQTKVPIEDWPSAEEDERLHRPVNIRV